MTDDEIRLGRREFIVAGAAGIGGCFANQSGGDLAAVGGGGEAGSTVPAASDALEILSGETVRIAEVVMGPYDGIEWEDSGVLAVEDGVGIQLESV